MLLLVTPQAYASWLGICPGTPDQAGVRVLDTFLNPAGATATVVAAATRLPACEMSELPVAAERLRWAKLLGRSEADALSPGFMLKGVRGETPFAAPQEIIPLREDTPAKPALPLTAELIPLLQVAAFGTEHRSALRRGTSDITLECAPGKAPAGALLKSRDGATLPAGASLAVQFDVDADGSFLFGTADAARERLGEPLVLGAIKQGPAKLQFPLPADFETAAWQFWVVECPATAARLTIRSVRLEPQSRTIPRRAFWAWQPSAWRTNPEVLLQQLAQHAADTVFVTIPLMEGNARVAEPAALERFVSLASERRIRVWAVIGDPRAVLPAERNIYIAMARAYAAYNHDAASSARLAGLQLDIEPYLNRGYQLDTENWLSAYLETLALLRPQVMMPVDAAVPFWWGRQPYRGGLFLDHLRPLVEVVTVMNYRTDRQQILDFAEPFLAWGARAKRNVRIGLEAGPIPDESLHVFRNTPQGELWLLPMGANALMLLLDTPQANPSGHAYAYSHTLTQQGSNTTFNRNVAAMRKLLPDLENIWRAWPSFSGIALHGLDTD